MGANLKKTGLLPRLTIKDVNQNILLQLDGSMKFSDETPEEFVYDTSGNNVTTVTVYGRHRRSLGDIIVSKNFSIIIIEDKIKVEEEEEED